MKQLINISTVESIKAFRRRKSPFCEFKPKISIFGITLRKAGYYSIYSGQFINAEPLYCNATIYFVCPDNVYETRFDTNEEMEKYLQMLLIKNPNLTEITQCQNTR